MRWHVVAERSTVVVAARSSMGPINFAAREPEGWIEATVVDDVVDLTQPVAASVEFNLKNLRSGSDFYDMELLRRIDARRHPLTRVELRVAEHLGGDRFQLSGELSFHDQVRPITGAVTVKVDDQRLLVEGEKVIDIRDFDVPAPTMLMVRIYPDVRVHLFLEARPAGAGHDVEGPEGV